MQFLNSVVFWKWILSNLSSILFFHNYYYKCSISPCKQFKINTNFKNEKVFKINTIRLFVHSIACSLDVSAFLYPITTLFLKPFLKWGIPPMLFPFSNDWKNLCNSIVILYCFPRQSYVGTCHSREGNMSSAISLFHKIINTGNHLTTQTLNDIFDGFYKKGEIHKARHFYNDIILNHI